MDVGLLASIAIMVVVPAVFVRPWPPAALESGIVDGAGGALLIGLAVGRITSVALDDPGAITSVSDLLIIRSGVEFWPGLSAGLAWVVIRARREAVSPSSRLGALAPPALIAWACYEATCLVRDGCPGPVSHIGLRPDGLLTRMLPIGLVVAIAAAGTALTVDRLHRRGMPSLQVVTLALAGSAAIRSAASIWLPHIGDGITRQHLASIIVLIATTASFVVLRSSDRHPASVSAP